MFCGVTDKFVTPNLNEFNLRMEYVPYIASPDLWGRIASFGAAVGRIFLRRGGCV